MVCLSFHQPLTGISWDAKDHGSFSFLRFADISVQEAHALHRAPLILRRLLATQDEARIRENGPYLL